MKDAIPKMPCHGHLVCQILVIIGESLEILLKVILTGNNTESINSRVNKLKLSISQGIVDTVTNDQIHL